MSNPSIHSSAKTMPSHRSVVFISADVKNYDTLLADLGNDVEVHILNTQQDGVLQMAAILQGRSDLDAIHILSHGNSGELFLGSTILNNDNLLLHSDALAQIGSSLSATGDILLYGCNVAQGETGVQFIHNLAQYTGADVAASNDLTGNAALGGDWVLEASTGAIEAKTENLPSYSGVLRDYNLDYSLAEMSNAAYDASTDVASWTRENSYSTSSGFYAVTFEKDNDIVIAYRGTNGDLGDIEADTAIGNPLNDWHQQFTDALNLAWQIRKDNPDKQIYVTGHSLGGSLAQVVTQAFGFDGATFDPGGAKNLTNSKNILGLDSVYTTWIQNLTNSTDFINFKLSHPSFNVDQGYGANFLNYVVNDSLVSGSSGDHIGITEPLDFFAYAADEKFIIVGLSLINTTSSNSRRPKRIFQKIRK